MKSRRHHQSAKRSRWAWNNSPDGQRNRRAKADARREAIAAALPPVYEGPAPLSEWQTLTVTLYVPAHGRCDQHATWGAVCCPCRPSKRLFLPVESMVYV